jgi:hypothetical protein
MVCWLGVFKLVYNVHLIFKQHNSDEIKKRTIEIHLYFSLLDTFFLLRSILMETNSKVSLICIMF